jgi:lysophospholipase
MDAPLLAAEGPAGAGANWLKAADGVRLRLVHWPRPAGGRGTVLVLPGRTEWAEKYALAAGWLAARGWGVLAVDWRGQGLADRARPDPLIGHVGDFAEYQRDLRAVLDWAGAQGLGPMPWMAHSMGGCIALRGLVAGLRPPAVALSAPMWGLATAPWLRAAVRIQARLARPFGRDLGYVPTTGPDYGLASMSFDLNPLTRDRAMFERMRAQLVAQPRFGLGGPSLRWMVAALAEMDTLGRAALPAVPAVIGMAGSDRIVSNGAIRAGAARWPGATLAEYPGAEHELVMERAEVREDLLARASALFEREAGA